MQFTALDLVTCAGILCFGSEEEYSHSDFDENSHYSDDEGDGAAADALIDGSDDDEEDEEEESGDAAGREDGAGKTDESYPATTCSNVSSRKNEHDVKPTSVAQQQVGKAKATDTTTADNKTSSNGESNHSANGAEGGVPENAVAKNLDVVNGKEVVYDNDGDDGTVDTALDVTQDVSASEEDGDESSDVEPADVKIELDDDDVDADIDAFVADLEDEFVPKKDEDEVTDASKPATEEEEEKEEEEQSVATSINTNKADEYSDVADYHACNPFVEYTPQEQKWNVKYADLQRYYKLYGTSKIPLRPKTKLKHMLLRRWADKQRKAYLKNDLTEEQIEKLVAVHALDLLEV